MISMHLPDWYLLTFQYGALLVLLLVSKLEEDEGRASSKLRCPKRTFREHREVLSMPVRRKS